MNSYWDIDENEIFSNGGLNMYIQHKQLGVTFIEVVSSDSLTLKTWWKISKLWPEIRVLFTEIVSDSLTLKT